MDSAIYTGESLSFYQLISKYRIEIPIIQRDYAQGREDKAEIRNNFLSALYDSLRPDQARLKLDFVYGSINKDSFIPLDGQQRLTTLFLLHWYAALKDDKLDPEVKALLSKFSYETRISSRDFCKALINNSTLIKKDCKISDSLIDSSWFFLSWKKDPTINAMLITIDSIHEKFYSTENIWECLTSESSPIYFYFVHLEDVGLTDDLYIKMNARGKLLSFFENFKASFQKHIQDNKWEIGVKHNDTFAFKIDTVWADLFWGHFRKDNNIDDSYMRFISVIAMIRISIERHDDRINLIRRLNENSNNIKPNMFSKSGFEYLSKCFDIYNVILKESDCIKLHINLWRHSQSKSITNQVIADLSSYTQKVLFYAQTEYLIRNQDINNEKYNDWIRVVRNIVARGAIEVSGNRPDIVRSPETFDGMIGLVTELAEGCSDIYAHLSSDIKIVSSFAKVQVDEEKLKAKLIDRDSDFKDIIWKLEDTDLLMGRIEFPLYCLGNKKVDEIDKVQLKQIAEALCLNFGVEKNLTNLLRRALLTISLDGIYEYYGYWWSYWYVGEATKRCLLGRFRELEYYIDPRNEVKGIKYRAYLKKLILKLCNYSLEEIVENFEPPTDMPNWKVRLIKEKALLDSNNSNYIAIPEDDSFCYLLKSKRPRDIEGSIKIE